jgi:hypothetical protein
MQGDLGKGFLRGRLGEGWGDGKGMGQHVYQASYEYEEVEVRKVIRALREAVAVGEARFETPRARKSGFKL